MAAAPDKDSTSYHEAAAPHWLGSAARRGEAQACGTGWIEPREDAQRPRWLGSAARRDGTQTIDAGWVEPEEAERPRWLGSAARRQGAVRSLVLIDMETPVEPAPSETEASRPEPSASAVTPETAPSATVSVLKPSETPDDRGQTRVVVGEIGMQLRIAS